MARRTRRRAAGAAARRGRRLRCRHARFGERGYRAAFNALNRRDVPAAEAAFTVANLLFTELADWPRTIEAGIFRAHLLKYRGAPPENTRTRGSWPRSRGGPPVHATVLALDAAGNSRHGTLVQHAWREGLRYVVGEALRHAGIPEAAVRLQDRGDCLLGTVAAEVPKAEVVADLAREPLGGSPPPRRPASTPGPAGAAAPALSDAPRWAYAYMHRATADEAPIGSEVDLDTRTQWAAGRLDRAADRGRPL